MIETYAVRMSGARWFIPYLVVSVVHVVSLVAGFLGARKRSTDADDAEVSGSVISFVAPSKVAKKLGDD